MIYITCEMSMAKLRLLIEISYLRIRYFPKNNKSLKMIKVQTIPYTVQLWIGSYLKICDYSLMHSLQVYDTNKSVFPIPFRPT